ncbi:MAG TPA: aldehyde dehydrogenase family protein [Pyrinomonadaceae bacterium]|nr:aldehyde dehydrogenase family protein [Pyrinomonadaceae bacterium]
MTLFKSFINGEWINSTSSRTTPNINRADTAQVAPRGGKVQAEMRGKNPVVVLKDCDMALAVESAAQGAFGSTGQRCTATSRAVVIDKVADEFVQKIVERAKSFKLGRSDDPASQIGPSADEGQFKPRLPFR